jgi:exopolyphosphatase/guanosine-5'-triphosphate,3'-diphosphate pyrophosphatase
VLSGDEEARLSLLAIREQYQPEQGVLGMLDIGGASTEISLTDQNGPLSKDSIRLGAVNATERFLSTDSASVDGLVPLSFHFNSLLAPLHLQRPDLLLGLGGTLTTLAAVQLEMAVYEPKHVEGAVLHIDHLEEMQQKLGQMSLEERQQVPGMEPGRADIILGGLAIALGTMRHLDCESVTVSDRGLRHGLLIDRFGEIQSNSTQ